MVVINRTKFPVYSIVRENLLFISKISLDSWEAANELKVLLYKAKKLDDLRLSGAVTNKSFDLKHRLERFTSRFIESTQHFHMKVDQLTSLLDRAAEGLVSYSLVAVLCTARCLEWFTQSTLECGEKRLEFYSQINAGNCFLIFYSLVIKIKCSL
jgi:hypothetical protein